MRSRNTGARCLGSNCPSCFPAALNGWQGGLPVQRGVSSETPASLSAREECENLRGGVVGDSAQGRPAGCGTSSGDSTTNPHHGFWSDADWLGCRDGKFRPVEPGTFPLANGIPARVGRLRGYGNAIVPKVAAEFIKAFMEAVNE